MNQIRKASKGHIICWWSGGVTSAIACKIAIDLYGIDNCRLVFIDTKNEDEDTYRFKNDCEYHLYNKEIETISAIPDKYSCIQDVWIKFMGLNFAHGAICSSELKRAVRVDFQKKNHFTHQVFGFDIDEPKRARAMHLNYPDCFPIFPLLFHGLSKEECIEIFKDLLIAVPRSYGWGFKNNNCLGTGCVQAGIGYWQFMFAFDFLKYDAMGDMEHYLTDLKGSPVTICKDQSKEAKRTGNTLVFLKKHPDYPEIKTVMEMKGHALKPLVECNGFCGINDLSERNPTEKEINNDQILLF